MENETQTTGNKTEDNNNINIEKAEERKENKLSPLEEAKIFLEENKKLLTTMTEERRKIEKTAADMMVAGRGFAGQQEREKSKEEIQREYINNVLLKGTGLKI